MRSKYIAPAFWLALVITIALTVTNAVGWISVSWWAVPYPILLYFSGLALVLIVTMAATKHAIRERVR